MTKIHEILFPFYFFKCLSDIYSIQHVYVHAEQLYIACYYYLFSNFPINHKFSFLFIDLNDDLCNNQ